MKSFQKTTTLSMAAAEDAVRSSLAQRGFGVLTEIDVAATLKAKLGIDRAPLKILGACNPSFANRALILDEAISLLLPCNVVLTETKSGTLITAVDPRSLMDSPEFNELAGDAAELLSAAIADVPAS